MSSGDGHEGSDAGENFRQEAPRKRPRTRRDTGFALRVLTSEFVSVPTDPRHSVAKVLLGNRLSSVLWRFWKGGIGIVSLLLWLVSYAIFHLVLLGTISKSWSWAVLPGFVCPLYMILFCNVHIAKLLLLHTFETPLLLLLATCVAVGGAVVFGGARTRPIYTFPY